MAQGKMKVKNANFQRKIKHHSKKKLGPKKGGKKDIAPRKNQKIKEKHMKQVLQKSINKSIEEELAQKAGASSLVIVKPSTNEDDSKKKKSK